MAVNDGKRPCCPGLDLLASQEGSFAVIFALCLMTVISLFAFVLDAGYLIKEKSSFQDCADQAAISAARNFCHGNPLEAAETVVYASHPNLPDGAVTVELGYYDAYGEYGNFPTYTDFISREDGDFPENEACNAVMVSIEAEVAGMTGFNPDKTVTAAAVAYVPRVSLFSGDDIDISSGENESPPHPASVNNGNIYGVDRIKLKGDCLGQNVKVASGDDEIWIYTVSGSSYRHTDDRESDDLPEEEVIEKFYLSDPEGSLEAYVEKLKAVADVVYTVEDAGTGYFYGMYIDGYTKYCCFDLTREHEGHEVIFLDAEGDAEGDAATVIALITPHACLNTGGGGKTWLGPSNPCMQQVGPTEAAGSEVKNLTFVTNAREISIYPNHGGRDPIPMGGENLDQVHFICNGQISYNFGNNFLRGVTFYGTSIDLANTFSIGNYNSEQEEEVNATAVSTGDIDFSAFTRAEMDETRYNFKFGPSCPTLAPPTLGRLESSPAED